MMMMMMMMIRPSGDIFHYVHNVLEKHIAKYACH